MTALFICQQGQPFTTTKVYYAYDNSKSFLYFILSFYNSCWIENYCVVTWFITQLLKYYAWVIIVCIQQKSFKAYKIFQNNNILFAPGKASNAGGVATSGLEMSQNSMFTSWSRDEVDQKLRSIMKSIHNKCIEYGKNGDFDKNSKKSHFYISDTIGRMEYPIERGKIWNSSKASLIISFSRKSF